MREKTVFRVPAYERAVQLSPRGEAAEQWVEVIHWIRKNNGSARVVFDGESREGECMILTTCNGDEPARPLDWIILESHGFAVVNPYDFDRTYQIVGEHGMSK